MGNLIAQAMGYASIAIFFGIVLLGVIQLIMMLNDEKKSKKNSCL
ncbi:MAG: hypothetical protein ACI4OW_02410 [Alphaproteobacteria bacterium]